MSAITEHEPSLQELRVPEQDEATQHMPRHCERIRKAIQHASRHCERIREAIQY